MNHADRTDLLPPSSPAMSLCVLITMLMLPLAHAVDMPSLYTVEVPLASSDRDSRSNAERTALTELLVRITGSPQVLPAEEIQSLFPDPSKFAIRYQTGADGTLIISFDGEAIERQLRETGAPIWGSNRPLTIVWLAVDWGQGEREILAADDPDRGTAADRSIDRNQMLRDRVQAVAVRRGVPVVFPLLDAEDLENIGFSDIWGGFDEPLLSASERYGAGSVLVGRIRPQMPRANRWTWYRSGQRQSWDGTPEDATNLLADSLAARDALPGDQAGEFVQLTVSGIDSVRAYGQLQQYMDALRVLDRLMVRTVAADKIIYDVEIRGGAERLRNALEQARFLLPEETFSVGRSLNYVYQPFDVRPSAVPSDRLLDDLPQDDRPRSRPPGQDRVRDPRPEPIPDVLQNSGPR